ncbi:hypothetical protein HD806DRAFT_390975 [Xylariaceae sp. AK1471]|nr:hypothetical protein HD806DRAFT_390975 [Xylariaceae sp. AK1471]
MFQPQPTPYAQFIPYGFHIANAGIPEYTFAPTPLLGQFGGHVGGNRGGDEGIARVGGGVGVGVRRGGPSPNNFHASAGVRGTVPARGLGASTTAPTTVGDHSAGYSSSGTNNNNNGHSRLYNMPMAVPPHHQHLQPQQQQHQHSRTHDRSILRHEMDQQPELDQSELAQQEAAVSEFKPRLEVCCTLSPF